jgi:hypothetical protein
MVLPTLPLENTQTPNMLQDEKDRDKKLVLATQSLKKKAR